VAVCVRVAFSGYEHEVIHVLSKIKNSNVTPKTSVARTPPSTGRQRKLPGLEFGVNYGRPCISSSETMVSYV